MVQNYKFTCVNNNMNEISFNGNLHCDKSIDKLSKTMSEGIKDTMQSFLSLERVQKAIPEDVFISAKKSKGYDKLFINIKDAEDTKFQTLLFKEGKNYHIVKDLLVYILGRYETKPPDIFRSIFEKDYVYNRAIEILKEKFPLK